MSNRLIEYAKDFESQGKIHEAARFYEQAADSFTKEEKYYEAGTHYYKAATLHEQLKSDQSVVVNLYTKSKDLSIKANTPSTACHTLYYLAVYCEKHNIFDKYRESFLEAAKLTDSESLRFFYIHKANKTK